MKNQAINKPSIDRLFDLQRFLYAFRNIQRVIHYPNKERENDTEHSYSLALTAWYISSYFPELDKDKIIRYALAHDLVEVHAGDTFAYGDPAHLASKHQREMAALAQIEKDWADFPDLIGSISAYEERRSPEAAFVYALDKIMPILAIYLANGHTWKEENITIAMLYDKKKTQVVVSPIVGDYFNQLYELLKRSPHLFRPSGANSQISDSVRK